MSAEEPVTLSTLDGKVESLDGKVDALQNDVKEIYYMLAKRQNGSKQFSRLTVQQKIATVYAELLITAKQAGVSLPVTD